MDMPNTDPSVRLKSLLREAGLKSTRLRGGERNIPFIGRTREWMYVARMDADWLNLYVMVCALPEEAGLRARLFQTVAALNAKMRLAKFSEAGGRLILEVDYRAEHLDGMVLKNLVGLLHAVAEEHYPRIFRVVTGDEVLDALAPQLAAPEAA
jgi:hypothetical protein